MWWARRPALAAATVYAVLACIFVGQGLVPGRAMSASDVLWRTPPWAASPPHGVPALGSNAELTDSATEFQPFLLYARSVFPHVPLWNPYIMGGRPFLANSQSAVFSPFSLPAYILPFWRSLAVIAALKLLLAAFGTYLVARALGMRFPGALLAGLVYGFGLFMVAWLTWTQTNVWTWIPWLLLLTELVIRRPGPLPVVGLAGVVAVQYLGGHPESSFDALVATGAFFTLRLLQSSRSRRLMARALLAFGCALASGAALAAIAIVPFIELLNGSWDISSSTFFTSTQRVPTAYLLGLVLPNYWGHPTHPLSVYSDQPFVAHAFYPGALALMLAGGALLLRPRVERFAVAAFGVVSLALVVGAEPLFSAIRRLPGLAHIRSDRLTILFLLCVALLAGWGLDDLVSGRRPSARRRRLLLAFSVALLLFPAVWMAFNGLSLSHLSAAFTLSWGFTTPRAALPFQHSREAIIHLAALLEWVVLAAAGAALVALMLRARGRRPLFGALAALLVACDLGKAGIGINPAIPIRHATQPTTGAIRYLQQREPARFVAVVAPTPVLLPPFPPNSPMKYGLFDARGYDVPVVRRYAAFWERNIAPVGFQPRLINVPASPGAVHALSMLSVTDLLQDPGSPPLHTPGLRVAYQGPDARVYANDHALPRVFVVDRQQVVRGARTALATVSSPGFDGRRVAVTEAPVPGLPAGGASGRAPPGHARLVAYGPERVVARASTTRPALLVLTDTYFPGWKATVDGKAAAVHQVDYLLRGVTLPPGSHRIEFRYQPTSWRVGWIVSAVTMVALGVAALLGWRREGRREVRRSLT